MSSINFSGAVSKTWCALATNTSDNLNQILLQLGKEENLKVLQTTKEGTSERNLLEDFVPIIVSICQQH